MLQCLYTKSDRTRATARQTERTVDKEQNKTKLAQQMTSFSHNFQFEHGHAHPRHNYNLTTTVMILPD